MQRTSQSVQAAQGADALRALGLERWLARRLTRLVLVAGVVVGLAGLATNAAVTFASRSGYTLDPGDTFVRNLATVAIWGALFEPLLWTCRALERWTRRLWVRLLVHAALSLVAAYGVGRLQEDVLRPRLGANIPVPTHAGRDGGDMRERPERRPDGPPESPRGGRERGSPRPPMGGLPPRPTGLFVYWALVGLCLGLDTYLVRRDEERRRARLALHAADLERALAEAQLSNLRHQLHPHFLFNTLHSIGGLVRQGEGAVAVETLSALGDLLRAMLDRELRPRVSLGDELELVEAYLDIERQRLGARLDVKLAVDVGVGRAEVPTLLLLPLLENAVQYAVAARAEGGCIELHARRDGELLVIAVRDDGPGFSAEVIAAGRGVAVDRASIGLANTTSRLRAMYGDAASFSFGSRADGQRGAEVRVALPFTPHDPEARP